MKGVGTIQKSIGILILTSGLSGSVMALSKTFFGRIGLGAYHWEAPLLDHVSLPHSTAEWVEFGAGPLTFANVPGPFPALPNLYAGFIAKTPLLPKHKADAIRWGVQMPLWQFSDASQFLIEYQRSAANFQFEVKEASSYYDQTYLYNFPKGSRFHGHYDSSEWGLLWHRNDDALLNELGVFIRTQERPYSARLENYPSPAFFEGFHRFTGVRLGHRPWNPTGFNVGYRLAVMAGSFELSDRQTRSHQYTQESRWVEAEMRISLNYSQLIGGNTWWYLSLRPNLIVGRQPNFHTGKVVTRTLVDYPLTFVIGIGSAFTWMP